MRKGRRRLSRLLLLGSLVTLVAGITIPVAARPSGTLCSPVPCKVKFKRCGICESPSCGWWGWGLKYYGWWQVEYDANGNIVDTDQWCTFWICGAC